MKIIKLDEYKDDSIYFYLFDKLIKDNYQNKEEYLNSIKISPSTYRRARLNVSSISSELLSKLCKQFNLNTVSKADIDELEEYINELYNNIYYKIDIDFDKELKYVCNKIKLNQIIYPIYKLLELFIYASRSMAFTKFIKNYYSTFVEVKKYIKVFNKDLNSIFELLELLFSEEIDNNLEYNNIICYQIISARLYANNRFIESLYYCNIVKEDLIRNLNFNRLYSINSAIMSNYIALGKYSDAYELAYKQLNSIKSNIKINYLYEYTMTNFILVCFITKKYQEIIKRIRTITELNNTLLTILVLTNKILKIDNHLGKFSYNNTLYNDLSKLDINNKINYDFLDNYNINNNLKNFLKKL